MLRILIVEDNERLRAALTTGLNAHDGIQVIGGCASGEEAVEICLAGPSTFSETSVVPEASVAPEASVVPDASVVTEASVVPDAILMDVHLAGQLNGIQAAVAIRRERPRLPVVFYSIQDDDAYYRDFRRSGILSHYAYVRKSNYLLPQMIVPLLHDAVSGRSFIDPDIEARVQEVRHKDEQSPMALLEPNEREVALMLAQGLSNEQIAARLGFRDKRTISRINGQIYTAWGLNETTSDEKIARTRVAIIIQEGRLIQWDDQGIPQAQDERGRWRPLNLEGHHE